MDLSVSRHLWIEIEEPTNRQIHWETMCIHTMANQLEVSIRGLMPVLSRSKKKQAEACFFVSIVSPTSPT